MYKALLIWGYGMKKTAGYVFRVLGITAAAYVYALAINYLYLPNKIISGGVTGIAMLIAHLTNISIGSLIIIINIPIFIIGYKQLGKLFVLYSILFVASSSFFIDITSKVTTQVDDLLLAAVFGGLMIGISVGITFRLGGSTAGVDIIAAILNRKYSLSIGEVILAINSVVIIASAFIYRIEYALYTLIAMFVTSKSMDIAQVGLMGRKTIFIISDNADQISDRLLNELGRGVTYLSGEGAFTHQSKKIIMCVITRLEITQLKEIVFRADPSAFLTISDTKEVVGSGFSTTSSR